MNFNDYAGLQAAIATQLNRTDLTADIPAFISLMEAQTERQLRTRDMIASTTITIDAEQEDLPTDLLETRNFFLNTNPIVPLEYRSIDLLLQYKQQNPVTGKPTEFSIIGSKFQFAKVPDSTYSATLVYYKKIPRLSNIQTTNWLLLSSPDIYFYGSLLNSAPYLREDARIAVWAQLYQSAVDALKVADDRAQSKSSGLKSFARTF